MLSCIFNADDYGLTASVTDAISFCIQKGSLQSTSMMTGGEDTENAFTSIKRFPHALVSVHLNLLEGKSVTEPLEIPDLVDKNGIFRMSLSNLWITATMGSRLHKERLLEQIFTEWCAQIDYVRERLPDLLLRLDGHLHVHAIPAIQPVIVKLIKKYPVEYIRTPAEECYRLSLTPLKKAKASLRRALLASWGKKLKRYLKGEGLKCADFFIGAALSGEMDILNLENALRHIAYKSDGRDAIAEIMLHPGYLNKTSSATSRYASSHQSAGRNAELEMLLADNFEETVKKYATFFENKHWGKNAR